MLTQPSARQPQLHGSDAEEHYCPGGNPGANRKSISHRCYLREEAFERELTKETIYLPLGCLQGGTLSHSSTSDPIGVPCSKYDGSDRSRRISCSTCGRDRLVGGGGGCKSLRGGSKVGGYESGHRCCLPPYGTGCRRALRTTRTRSHTRPEALGGGLHG
jgi:hypothetical protein